MGSPFVEDVGQLELSWAATLQIPGEDDELAHEFLSRLSAGRLERPA